MWSRKFLLVVGAGAVFVVDGNRRQEDLIFSRVSEPCSNMCACVRVSRRNILAAAESVFIDVHMQAFVHTRLHTHTTLCVGGRAFVCVRLWQRTCSEVLHSCMHAVYCRHAVVIDHLCIFAFSASYNEGSVEQLDRRFARTQPIA